MAQTPQPRCSCECLTRSLADNPDIGDEVGELANNVLEWLARLVQADAPKQDDAGTEDEEVAAVTVGADEM